MNNKQKNKTKKRKPTTEFEDEQSIAISSKSNSILYMNIESNNLNSVSSKINHNKHNHGYRNLIMDNQVELNYNNQPSISSLCDIFYKKLFKILVPNIEVDSFELSYDHKYIKYILTATFSQQYKFELIMQNDAVNDTSYVLYRPIDIPYHDYLDPMLSKEFEFLINDLNILIIKFSKC